MRQAGERAVTVATFTEGQTAGVSSLQQGGAWQSVRRSGASTPWRANVIEALTSRGTNESLDEWIGVSRQLHRRRAVRPKSFASRIPSILSLLKTPFSLRQLMLQPTMDTLLGDVGPGFTPPDPPHMGTFARCASARGAGFAAPVAGTAALPASAVATRACGPLALGRALACADGMANGARHRQA
jgi:hypothetical protein